MMCEAINNIVRACACVLHEPIQKLLFSVMSYLNKQTASDYVACYQFGRQTISITRNKTVNGTL